MANDKMGKVHKIIGDLMDLVKGDPDMAAFLSVIQVDDKAFEGVAYDEGTTQNVINAICHGISLMADSAEEVGVDREKFLSGLVATISRFDTVHIAQKQLEEKDSEQSGTGGNA